MNNFFKSTHDFTSRLRIKVGKKDAPAGAIIDMPGHPKIEKPVTGAPVAPKKETTKKKPSTWSPAWFVKFSIKDQVLFAKRLSFLINAGVTILESLHILSEQAHSKSIKRVYEKLIADVSNGMKLADALARHKGVFGDFAINLIRVGETTGALGKNLHYLADELKKKADLRRKVIGSLIYPVIISVATILLTALLTVFIFPKILPIFSSMNVDLPMSTRVLIVVSDFLQNYGLLTAGLIVVLIITFFVLHKKVLPFRFFTDRLLLKLPLVGGIAKNYNMANFSRTFGLLLKSGVPVMESLDVVGNSTRNLFYRKECHKMVERVRRGEEVSKYLIEHPRRFPHILAHMVAVGEKTGKLSDTLVYLSDFYEGEVDDQTKNLSTTIEPVLMVFLGTVVGFVAVSVITPIYEITGSLSR
ncbi:MAG: type II secretion system F family protein [Patescibacteria group bacterium]